MQNFPNKKQKVGTNVCGPLCLVNIFENLGDKALVEDIMEDLGVTENEITYLPQLALYAHKNNLKIKYLQSNPREISPNWKGLESDKYLETLKKFQEEMDKESIWKKNLKFLIEYIEAGGEIEVDDLSREKISQYLAEGYVVLAAVEQTWLWGKRKVKGKIEYDDLKGKPSGHFVVIYKEDGDDFLVSDPYPTGLEGKEGLYRVSKDTMLVSILVWGAQMIGVKSKV
ncbi:hypothetical protein GF389_02360 [Candidatus Dojkabacteria bacterium]|nr:hypothetical protein [Candidatus Dojkabacteria bacterium]